MKELLVSDRVMAYYDPELSTRVYVDESLVGMASTFAQQHTVVNEVGEETQIWRPVDYTSLTNIEGEKIFKLFFFQYLLLYFIFFY